jgi:hypothetical protein
MDVKEYGTFMITNNLMGNGLQKELALRKKFFNKLRVKIGEMTKIII